MIPTIISEGKAFNKMQVVHNELYHHLLKNMWDLLVEGLARFGPGEHSRRLFTATAKTPAEKSCLRGFSHVRGAECRLTEIAIKNPKLAIRHMRHILWEGNTWEKKRPPPSGIIRGEPMSPTHVEEPSASLMKQKFWLKITRPWIKSLT